MTPMLEKLADFMVGFLRFLQFVTIVSEYQAGVVLRFGRFAREARPGALFFLPFMIERVLITNVVDESMVVGPQSLTTRDGVGVVVSSVVVFRVYDSKHFLLELEDGNRHLQNLASCVVAGHVSAATWNEMKNGLPGACFDDAVRIFTECGATCVKLQLVDFARSRPIRLLGSSSVASIGWTEV